MSRTKKLDIADITVDGTVQAREGLDWDTVDDYSLALKNEAKFPPLVVFFDGAVFWLADGFHRLAAMRTLKIKTAQCEMHTGSKRDAIIYAAGANTTNGRQRSPEDKRRAVRNLLNDKQWSKKSDRSIARHCHVSNTFATDQRKIWIIEQGKHKKTEGKKMNNRMPREATSKKTSTRKRGKPGGKDPFTSTKDRVGTKIPQHIGKHFDERYRFEEIARAIKSLKQAVQLLGQDTVGTHLETEQALAQLDNLRLEITDAAPHAICPWCKAATPESCKACKGSGFVTKIQYDNFSPEAIKP